MQQQSSEFDTTFIPAEENMIQTQVKHSLSHVNCHKNTEQHFLSCFGEIQNESLLASLSFIESQILYFQLLVFVTAGGEAFLWLFGPWQITIKNNLQTNKQTKTLSQNLVYKAENPSSVSTDRKWHAMLRNMMCSQVASFISCFQFSRIKVLGCHRTKERTFTVTRRPNWLNWLEWIQAAEEEEWLPSLSKYTSCTDQTIALLMIIDQEQNCSIWSLSVLLHTFTASAWQYCSTF